MIWQYASADGANHGPSCAAFASLTLELGSHIAGAGQLGERAAAPTRGRCTRGWTAGWTPTRPHPASYLSCRMRRTTVAGTARGWIAAPMPGDWVLFDGHVEVVTRYHGGVLHTIGGDSLPNLSVNAHEYAGPLRGPGCRRFRGQRCWHVEGTRAGGGSHPDRAVGTGDGPGPGRGARQRHPSPPADHCVPWRIRYCRAIRGVRGRSRQGGGGGGGASAGPVSTADAMRASSRSLHHAPYRCQPRHPAVGGIRRQSRALPAQGALPLHGDRLRRPRAGDEHASGAGTGAGNGPGSAGGYAGAGPPAPGAVPGPRGASTDPVSARGGKNTETRPEPGRFGDMQATGLQQARPQRARPGEAAIPGLLERTAPAPCRRMRARSPRITGTTRREAACACQARPPSRPSSTRSPAAPWQPSASTACRPRSRLRRPSTSRGGVKSVLAANDHNLFGIKGTGPAGSDEQPTQEVINGQVVNLSASFQIYQEHRPEHRRPREAPGTRRGDYASAMSKSRGGPERVRRGADRCLRHRP